MSKQRFHCSQLPGVTIIGKEGIPQIVLYMPHKNEFKKLSIRYPTIAKNAFMKVTWKKPKASSIDQLGRLCPAFLNGPLDMIYSYCLHSGGRGGPLAHLNS